MSKVSVIIPVYNVEKYLSKCLDSVIEQTFKDIEIICINDGSTDNSQNILQEYAKKDNRIMVVNQENSGLSVARNIGIAKASADYISFIDADDFIHPNFLKILYNVIQETKSDIAGCNFQKIKGDSDIIPKPTTIKAIVNTSPLQVLLHRKNYIHFNVWNKLYRRTVIRDVRFPEGICFEDWVFNTIVFDNAKNFAWINQPLYGYRITNNSIMRSSFNEKKLQDYVCGIKIVYDYYKNKEKLQIVKRTRIARTVKMMMNSAIRSDNKNIYAQAKRELKALYNQKLIGYRGLSFTNKLKLFKFLH